MKFLYDWGYLIDCYINNFVDSTPYEIQLEVSVELMYV
jgi:hypothetical protein